MPPSPASSFIPKRNPVNRPKSVRRYNFVIIPILSYTLFMSALFGAGALFIYQIKVNSQFHAAVQNLEDQIQGFNDSDLTRVVAFDERLGLAKKLLATHVSIVSLLTILENSTAATIQFKDLSITRKDDATLAVTAGLMTSSLDGALFQRGIYRTESLIATTTVSDAKLLLPTGATDGKSTTKESVELKADFVFTTDKILYKPLTLGGSSVGSETLNPNSDNPSDTTTNTTSL